MNLAKVVHCPILLPVGTVSVAALRLILRWLERQDSYVRWIHVHDPSIDVLELSSFISHELREVLLAWHIRRLATISVEWRPEWWLSQWGNYWLALTLYLCFPTRHVLSCNTWPPNLCASQEILLEFMFFPVRSLIHATETRWRRLSTV